MAKIETAERGRPGRGLAGMRRAARAIACAGCLGLAVTLGASAARAETCGRADFEAVVDEASSTLLKMTQANTPSFQAKLRALKDKRGWTQDQLMREGQPFVRDERIAAYDERSEQLLIKINTQGGDGSNCKALATLREDMRTLVETQTAKWTYMLEKIEKELAR